MIDLTLMMEVLYAMRFKIAPEIPSLTCRWPLKDLIETHQACP